MSSAPVRFDRIQAGLVASVADAIPTATVLWAGQALPHGIAGQPLARLRLVAGPTDVERYAAPAMLPTAATLTIAANAEGDRIVLQAAGLEWAHVVPAGEAGDATAQRDTVLALLDAALVSWTVAAQGADQITIAADALGDLYGLRAISGASVVVDTETAASVRVGDVSALIELDVHHPDPSLRGGAAAQIQHWIAQSRNRAGQALLRGYALAFSRNPPSVLSIDGLAGSRWESRARASFQVLTLSIHAETFDPVESAAVTLIANAP